MHSTSALICISFRIRILGFTPCGMTYFVDILDIRIPNKVTNLHCYTLSYNECCKICYSALYGHLEMNLNEFVKPYIHLYFCSDGSMYINDRHWVDVQQLKCVLGRVNKQTSPKKQTSDCVPWNTC